MARQTTLLSLLLFALLAPLSAYGDVIAGSTLPQTGQTTCYSSSGTEIDCANTGQDGDSQTGVPWPEPRFSDNGNGTVSDNLTGLIWLKNANCFGDNKLQDALTITTNLADGQCGLADGSTSGEWRLPNALELRSLVNFEPPVAFNWLTSQGFINVHDLYWTSTTHSGGAHDLTLQDGHMFSRQDTERLYFWPVRDGMQGSVAVPIPLTGQTVSYYTRDDGALQKGSVWPSPRFVFNADQTVTDRLTNLVWTKNAKTPGPTSCIPNSTKNWQGALDYVKCLNDNNYLDKTDWRLPNVLELASLAYYGQPKTVDWLNSQGFADVQRSNYWTSSTRSSERTSAWYVNMYAGYLLNYNKQQNMYVWPIRGGQTILDSLIISGSFQLGIQSVGSTTLPGIITLHNRGTQTQSINSITLTGANYEQFNISPGGSTPCASLAPTLASGEKCNLLLTFTPSSIGEKSAYLSVVSNGKTMDILVYGTGISTISGTVHDLSTGSGLSSAIVTINGVTNTKSGSNGDFVFKPSLPPGSYNVSVSKDGYTGYTINNVSLGSVGAVVNFYITQPGPLNVLNNSVLKASTVNEAYSEWIKISGGARPYIYSVVTGRLPAGLVLDTSLGKISGTPINIGTYTFSIGVTDSGSAYAEKTLSIDVSNPFIIANTSSLPTAIKGDSFNTTITATGGTLPYTFTISNGTLPPGLTLGSNGTLSGIPTTLGVFSFYITATDASARTVTRYFTINVDPKLVITTNRLNDGIVGTFYSQTLTTTGNIGNTAWSLTSGTLPDGLILNPVTGTISGTPSTSVNQQITLSAQDSAGRTASKPYTIIIATPLSILTSSMPNGYVSVPYSVPLQATGGIAPYSLSLTGVLPAGLTLNTYTGFISGTPSAEELVNFNIAVFDSSYPTPQTTTKGLSLRTLAYAEAVATPSTLVVPAADADGSYTVSWSASATTGASYVLEEATDATFTTGLTSAYSGTELSVDLSGRSTDTTYYYRLKAIKDGYRDSDWRGWSGSYSCAVPGALATAVPVAMTIPPSDADGAYLINWNASATQGVTYVVQESTDPTFAADLRIVYVGPGLNANMTNRMTNKTYYYRVRAMKPGYRDSGWQGWSGDYSCAVSGISQIGTPGAIAVPASDADGAYTISWGAVSGTGIKYLLQEATDPTFSMNLHNIYFGAALSVNITGRANNTTYFYRVKAVNPGYRDSQWAGWSGSYNCAVPGSAVVTAPGAIVLPAADPDGNFTVSWGPSTLSGVTYLVQEATNVSFSKDLRTVYYGTGLNAEIRERAMDNTYYYRVKALKPGYRDSGWVGWSSSYFCAVPGTSAVSPPWAMTLPISSAYGNYTVSWGASTTPGVTYLVQEATNPTFSSNLHTTYIGTALSVNVTGRATNTTYYYRVKAVKPGYRDSGWEGWNGSYSCAVPGTATTGAPGAVTLPASDGDGTYTISWAASPSTGVTYHVQEATNPTFSTGLRTAYFGTALTANINGRGANTTYYYRVKAIKPGYMDSEWRGWTGSYSCAVPGSNTTVIPGPIEVPQSDPDGNYTVNWYASPNGSNYLLQEATDPTFNAGLRTAYYGPGTSISITGRATDTTYYYRVKAVKPGYRDSGWDGWSGSYSCAVPGLSTAPAPSAMTVPSGDPDGAYGISWGAAPLPGASYLVQEAQETTFTTALRTAYYGTALSANITGRVPGIEYHYRVKTVNPGYLSSDWVVSANGCPVPGTQLAPPSGITVPANDSDGTFVVSWGASTTSGAQYLLEEATDPGFTVGLRTAYYSTGLSTTISGRAAGKTYYYRVKAIKRGYLDSNWTISASGCAVP